MVGELIWNMSVIGSAFILFSAFMVFFIINDDNAVEIKRKECMLIGWAVVGIMLAVFVFGADFMYLHCRQEGPATTTDILCAGSLCVAFVYGVCCLILMFGVCAGPPQVPPNQST